MRLSTELPGDAENMGARGPHIEHKGLEDEPYSSNPPYLQLFSDAVYVCIAYVSLRPRVPPSLSGAGREGLSSSIYSRPHS